MVKVDENCNLLLQQQQIAVSQNSQNNNPICEFRLLESIAQLILNAKFSDTYLSILTYAMLILVLHLLYFSKYIKLCFS